MEVRRTEPEATVVENRVLGRQQNLRSRILELLLFDGLERLGPCGHALFCGDVTLFDHLIDDGVAGTQRDLTVVREVVERGVADRHRKRGGLGDREFAQFLVEVDLGGSGDAVCVFSEEDRVEVELEDLFFGEPAFEFDRDRSLSHLPLERWLTPDEVLFYDLLGDRRTALGGATPEVLDECPGDRLVVDPAVGHEVGVFGAECGSNDEVRDVVERNRLAVAFRQLAQYDTIGGVDGRQPGQVGQFEGHRFHVGDPVVANVLEGSVGGVRPEEHEESHPSGKKQRDRPEDRARHEPPASLLYSLCLVDGDVHGAIPSSSAAWVARDSARSARR